MIKLSPLDKGDRFPGKTVFVCSSDIILERWPEDLVTTVKIYRIWPEDIPYIFEADRRWPIIAITNRELTEFILKFDIIGNEEYFTNTPLEKWEQYIRDDYYHYKDKNHL